ncbi:SDR family oxidoreductase [Naasia lichenicola]|uniref:3-beta hydroxysteroid dehydrogenase n=1 Tax=Naasia lichenicola TaxID=2565933 RepID=A0A4V3WTV6_9MICO|nr:NAD(P)H-binding protein [Naasia lichenicola]THG33417.1 3-beta hydroxysteroid dehydrogenase [Naasia lichenicola]
MRIAIAGGTGTVGRHIVSAVRAQGDEPVVLSRARGVDIESGAGLEKALAGVDAVIDAYGPATSSAVESMRRFRAATDHLLAAERSSGVRHHVALSIVGARQIDAGYYRGKRVQEDLVSSSYPSSGVGWSILRTTQFHEFAQQMVGRMSFGPLVAVPTMLAQPVAASEVAAALASLAAGPPRGLAPDFAGPRVERMPDMVRRYLSAIGRPAVVVPVALPGRFGRSLRDGSLLPAADAVLGTVAFDDWRRTVRSVGSI